MVETQGNIEQLAQEIDENSFNDRRLGRRFREFMANFWKNIGITLPFACQDWVGTKAAYHFLSNLLGVNLVLPLLSPDTQGVKRTPVKTCC
ncbi:TPA: IS4/Tn5 family transposase DNA-binding protein [Salmonella enterica subsp. enterica serovar Muenchen]